MVILFAHVDLFILLIPTNNSTMYFFYTSPYVFISSLYNSLSPNKFFLLAHGCVIIHCSIDILPETTFPKSNSLISEAMKCQ